MLLVSAAGSWAGTPPGPSRGAAAAPGPLPAAPRLPAGAAAEDGAAGGRCGGRSGFGGAGRRQRRRLAPRESPLPYPPPARRQHRPPRRGVARKGGESPATGRGCCAPAGDHSPDSDAGSIPQASPEAAAASGTAAPVPLSGRTRWSWLRSRHEGGGGLKPSNRGGEAAETELLETPSRSTSWALEGTRRAPGKMVRGHVWRAQTPPARAPSAGCGARLSTSRVVRPGFPESRGWHELNGGCQWQ